MKNFLAAAILALSTQSAFAVYSPTWERPLQQADMSVSQSQYEFEGVREVQLTLNRRDGATQATSLSLRYTTANGEQINRQVPIAPEQITQDRCGGTRYQAQLSLENDDNPYFERLNIELQDHSLQRCRTAPAHRWEASVRHGYGFCGTMDSTMTLIGTPDEVYTTMSGANPRI